MEWISELDKARFWIKVTQTESCWIWSGSKNNNGYGIFQLDGQKLAHRMAYLMINGSIPNELCVCHTCDNPQCVNPTHLFLGTHQDNMVDKVYKGRSRIQGKSSPFYGVGWRKDAKKWRAYVMVNRKLKNIGTFGTPIEAALFREKYISDNNIVAIRNKSLPPTPTKQ